VIDNLSFNVLSVLQGNLLRLDQSDIYSRGLLFSRVLALHLLERHEGFLLARDPVERARTGHDEFGRTDLDRRSRSIAVTQRARLRSSVAPLRRPRLVGALDRIRPGEERARTRARRSEGRSPTRD
jgi:hypothetical protein